MVRNKKNKQNTNSMFEYCFEEISRSSYRFDSNLSTVLTTLQETYVIFFF